MAIGFTDLTSTVRRPDKLMQASSTPNILSANFGDGYQQRIAKGINNLQQQYVVSFANRTKEEIDDITAFFTNKGGVTKFDFTIPDSISVPITPNVLPTNVTFLLKLGLTGLMMLFV